MFNKFQDTDGSPILIPSNSYVEGYLKSLKSIRIECNFNGTILSQKKVIIESNSVITGDIICGHLILTGTIKGNVFCTGRVEMNPESKMIGKIYTSTFTNLSETDSDFVVQIPNVNSLGDIRSILFGMDTDKGLSKDEVLTKIRDLFYENVYSNRYHPDAEIQNEFTSPSNGKVVLMNVKERNKDDSFPPKQSNEIKY
jgi:hypothetical protein